MNRTRTLIASAIVAAAGVLTILFATGSVQVTPAFASFLTPIDTNKGPKLGVNEIDHDFGKVEQQTNAETNFTLTNNGTDTLLIMSANPSCGCTAAVLGDKSLAPGKSTKLHVTFDPHNKAEGPFTKVITIVSNSVVEPQKQVRIHGMIYRSKLAHKESMHLDGLFQGNCASCHVDKGKGELGAKLYEADCAVCHGMKSDNKPGADIAADDMMNHTPEQWKTIIANGKINTNMPAFHTKNKGPLNDDEIASLVDYLGAFKKNLMRERSMKSSTTGAATNATKQ
jgi:mono/diheme cytochrome c family protein